MTTPHELLYPGVRPVDFAAEGKPSLERFFTSVPLLSLARPFPSVITVSTSDSLPCTLEVLGQHHFISAPVLQPGTQQLLGIVSVNDLAVALVTIADAAVKEIGVGSDMNADRLQCLIAAMQTIWRSHTAEQVMNISHRSALVALPHSASVWDALVKQGRDGAHSVVVMKADGTGPEAFFSQGALVNYLFHHLRHFSSIARLMVQQVSGYSQVGSPRPVQIADDAPLLEAFRLIRDQRVTAVMVVNHGRTLVGVISASDVRMMGPNLENAASLFRTTGEFVRKAQASNDLLLSQVVSCTPVETVGMVMEKMLDNDVHRIFVVRTHHGMEQEVPMDVLALRDILMLFCPD